MPVSLKITVKSQALVFDKTQVRRALRAAGNEVAAAARSTVRRSVGSGKFYYASGSSGGHGRYQASAAGQAPVSVSGQLARSITVGVKNDRAGDPRVSIKDSAPYAKALEVGAKGGGFLKGGGYGKRPRQAHSKANRGMTPGNRNMAPRPYISAAMDQRRSSIEARLVAAINSGLKFKRIK